MAVDKDVIYDKVTQSIIATLEKGVVPWVKPWDCLGGPRNFVTGAEYSGMNVIILWAAAHCGGFRTDQWLTFNQAKALGANVKKGSQGTCCIFYKKFVKKEPQPDGSVEETVIPLLRSFTLFNVDQCEFPEGVEVYKERETVFINNDLADAIIAKSGASIMHTGDKACFIPASDRILMPHKDQFHSEEAYYSVGFHELVHWTGGATRLNRNLSTNFGSEAYAAEELVAELGSAFLCTATHIQANLQHPQYVASWLKVLKQDKTAIFKASKLAKKAADYLLDKAGTTPAQEESDCD